MLPPSCWNLAQHVLRLKPIYVVNFGVLATQRAWVEVTNRQTDRQADRQTDRWTNRQTTVTLVHVHRGLKSTGISLHECTVHLKARVCKVHMYVLIEEVHLRIIRSRQRPCRTECQGNMNNGQNSTSEQSTSWKVLPSLYQC